MTAFKHSDAKVFRDPIYNLISFPKEGDYEVLLRLIDCPEVQRLRRIRQLGLSYVTYPTAVHDRFSHALGVAYLVGQIVDNLRNFPETINIPGEEADCKLDRDQFRLLLQIAGLLHDIGHGPFSHAFERVMNENHEDRTIQIIRDTASAVNCVLRSLSVEPLKSNGLRWVCELLDGTFGLIWARDIISGQMSADRMDYLQRDAYMCGVQYARFDRQWILNNMQLAQIPQEDNRDSVVLNGRRGIYSLESFIISRYHMYEQVYFHKTTRGMEQVVIKIFERARHLVSHGVAPAFIDDAIENIFRKVHTLADYLAVDDFGMISQIRMWLDAEDEILRTLSNVFLNRHPFKMVKEVKDTGRLRRDDYRKLDALFSDKDKADYFYFEDDYTNNPYKDDYLLGKGSPEDAGHIWLLTDDGSVRELAEESDLIKALRNKISKRTRSYVYRPYHEQVSEVFQ